MGVLPDWMIERDVGIEPFSPAQKRPGLISFGVSSFGYDVRAGYKFQIFTPIGVREIDPKNFDPKMMVEVDLTPNNYHAWSAYQGDPKGPHRICRACGQQEFPKKESAPDDPCPARVMTRPDHVLIPPHSFALAESLETFRIPRDVLCIVVGKSTYARCGLVVNVTPGEPEWEGRWTIELSNTTPLPVRVYAGEGIMQCVFIRSESPEGALGHKRGCDQSYADKKGKYQHQTGVTAPRVDASVNGSAPPPRST